VVNVKTGSGGKTASKQSLRNQFIWAEGQQESGGDYLAVNPNSGALGRWQVMPANLPAWLPESGQPILTPQQFLNSQAAQNAVAETILGGYFDTYGAAGAAAMWYSGQPNPTETYGDPPVYQYVDDVLALMGEAPVSGFTAGGYSQLLPWSVPAPTKTDSWAGEVSNTALILQGIGASANHYGDYIRRTYRK